MVVVVAMAVVSAVMMVAARAATVAVASESSLRSSRVLPCTSMTCEHDKSYEASSERDPSSNKT